jgi:predicted nucleic acid-binding Zn ribbon protein
VLFKGSGFYCTDNRKSGGNGSKAKGKVVGKKDEASKKSSKDED